MKRIALAGALLLAAGLWVGLLALTAPSATVAPAASGPSNSGSKAQSALIKLVDKSSFAATDSSTGDKGQITLRMDILDAAGKPIADLKAEDFAVVEAGERGRIKSFKGPATQAVNIMLVIDVSGSMNAPGRMRGAQQAATTALETLKNNRDFVGLIAFDNTFEIRLPLEQLDEKHRSECVTQIDRLRPRGATSIGPPVVAAVEHFGRRKTEGLKMVLLLTDGDDNNPDQFANQRRIVGKLCDDLGVQVHTIAVGKEVSKAGVADLTDLAEKGKGRFAMATDPDALAELFRSRVQESVNECTLVYDSPYPEPDGANRDIKVTVNTANGPLTATASYAIGAIVAGGSKRAMWLDREKQQAGTTSATSSVAGRIVPVMLFIGAFVVLVGGLALPGRLAKASPAPETSAPPTTAPVAPKPPPPPPVRMVAPPPPRNPAPVTANAPPRPGVIKPPPPPPPPGRKP